MLSFHYPYLQPRPLAFPPYASLSALDVSKEEEEVRSPGKEKPERKSTFRSVRACMYPTTEAGQRDGRIFPEEVLEARKPRMVDDEGKGNGKGK